jgi:xylose isomerase
MDTFAKGLLVADKLMADRALEDFTTNRYASFSKGIGKKIIDNATNFEELSEYALEHDHIVLQSGRQEMLEDIVNRYIYKA